MKAWKILLYLISVIKVSSQIIFWNIAIKQNLWLTYTIEFASSDGDHLHTGEAKNQTVDQSMKTDAEFRWIPEEAAAWGQQQLWLVHHLMKQWRQDTPFPPFSYIWATPPPKMPPTFRVGLPPSAILSGNALTGFPRCVSPGVIPDPIKLTIKSNSHRLHLALFMCPDASIRC